MRSTQVTSQERAVVVRDLHKSYEGVEAVRGVNIDGVLQTLMERGLVKIAGRAEIPGRPLLYETTQFFLDHFGLRNLDELPNVEELRRRDLPSVRPVTPAAAPESG